jgi:hypothetical protein
MHHRCSLPRRWLVKTHDELETTDGGINQLVLILHDFKTYHHELKWLSRSGRISWLDMFVSRGKITTGTFGRVKMEADHHTPLGMGPHHVTPRSAPCILQFVRLDRWGSLTRFLHYSYHYDWSRDHPCSLPLLRDSYEPDTPLANSQ